jgi:hypothetical protein
MVVWLRVLVLDKGPEFSDTRSSTFFRLLYLRVCFLICEMGRIFYLVIGIDRRLK